MISARSARTSVLVLVALLGCSGVTNVDAPDLVQPRDLETPTGAVARYVGAVARFAGAYQDQVTQSGVITDEFQDVGGTGSFPADRRTITPDNSEYPFSALSLARINALRAIESLGRFNPQPPARIGELYSLIGFMEVMFAENLCSPVPLAVLENGIPTAAPTHSRDELLHGALAAFDSAAAYAATNDTILNLARVGRGRALLSLGDVARAAEAVAAVPLTFAYRVPYSSTTTGQMNRVYERIATNRILSVSDREGINGLPFVSSKDPRVGAASLGISRGAGLPLYNFAKNVGLGAPIVLASGVEASLIRAEAALARGDVDAWADTLNALRQKAITPPLRTLPDDSTVAASAQLRRDVLFMERAFWLYGTGHRHGDLRRLIRQYGRPAETVFPTGPYISQGLQYGTDVTFVPRGEDPNPVFRGCEDTGV